MKKGTQQHNKLVRDLIPEVCERNGHVAVTRKLSEDEYPVELEKKLREEVEEFLQSGDAEELADLLEVVYALGQLKGLEMTDLDQLRAAKAENEADLPQDST
jgi:predicted house-cleaning noncanonical NTP pyrophosphatase (MazG superfamily)